MTFYNFFLFFWSNLLQPFTLTYVEIHQKIKLCRKSSTHISSIFIIKGLSLIIKKRLKLKNEKSCKIKLRLLRFFCISINVKCLWPLLLFLHSGSVTTNRKDHFSFHVLLNYLICFQCQQGAWISHFLHNHFQITRSNQRRDYSIHKKWFFLGNIRNDFCFQIIKAKMIYI